MMASFAAARSESDVATRARLAVARAIELLERRQLANGELSIKVWRPAAPEWVHDPSIFATALAAWSLRDVPGTERIRSRACDFIERQRELHGVWRHWTRGHEQFHYVPPDLDDTSIACLALRADGRRVPRNRGLMLANRAQSGLFYSWISARRLWVGNVRYWWIALVHLMLHPGKSLAFYHITPSRRHDIDAVVNANILFYLGRDGETEPVIGLLTKVLRDREEAGCDKWYDSPFVVWYFFSRALRRAGAEAGGLILGRLRGARPDSALERALAACVTMDWDERPDTEKIEAIIAEQLPSGAWPLAPFYKGGRVRWGSEELTTAFCIEALSRWLGRWDA
jgi:hypothetical protein